MKLKEYLKDVEQSTLKFAAGAAGMTVASFLLKFGDKLIPANVPTILRQIGPGLAGILLAVLVDPKVKNKYGQDFLFGFGIGAAADGLRKVIAPASEKLAAYIPALSGMQINTGDYPPSFYRENIFQGFAGPNPYALGSPNPYALGGPNPYALGGNAYRPLNGNAYRPLNGNADFGLQGDLMRLAS